MSQYLQATPGSPPDDWPHYGIDFGGAIKRGLRKYAVFTGRASLSEYWWWVLFYISGLFGLSILGALFARLTSPDGGVTDGPGAVPFYIIASLFLVVTILPTIAASVRRLHDAGFSGWLYLLSLLPFGGLALIVLLALPTSPAGAKYGPPPPLQHRPDMVPYPTPRRSDAG